MSHIVNMEMNERRNFGQSMLVFRMKIVSLQKVLINKNKKE